MSYKKVEFLNPEKNGHVIVPAYLEKAYKEGNYYLLPKNILLKKIIIFLNIKIIRKIKIIYRFITKNQIYFSHPPKKEVIVFDDENFEVLKKIFLKENYFILATRLNKINKVYLSKKIIIYLVKNLFKRSLKQNYLYILIKLVDPKKVITFIDNSIDFFLVSKLFKNTNIKFIAIQNSHRYEIHAKNQDLHIPNYLVFGEHEVKIFKKHSGIKSITPIGSLSAAVAKSYFVKEKTSLNLNKYDICLISEPRLKLNYDFKRIHDEYNVQDYVGKTANHTLKFCKKNNKSIIFSGKSDLKSKNFQMQEEKFYEKFIKDYNIKISFNKKEKFDQYKNIAESRLIIGMSSTMLRDAFEFKKKILICNFINHEDAKPPSYGICTLDSNHYDDFEKRVKEIMALDYEEYLSKIDNISHIYNTKINALDFLRNEIN